VYGILAKKFEDLGFTIPCAGEISVLADRDKLLDFWLERNWGVQFMTNAVIYNETIAEILKNPDSSIIVSIDCGSRETCRKVKRADVFNNIVSNIKKYRETGGRMELKYVLLPGYNDELNDIDGFAEIVAGIKPWRAVLSFDVLEYRNKSQIGNIKPRNIAYNEKMSESLFATCAYFVARIKETGIPIAIASDRFSNPDYERLSVLIKNFIR
jgi:pyruvate-formate lyase-activating enzyme